MQTKAHTFHIPVMGIGYTVDTAIKVAHLGIDSVLSLVDDGLIEKMREFHCKENGVEFRPISLKKIDYRAERITAYLNLLHDIVIKKFNALKNQSFEVGTELHRYISLLPDENEIKLLYTASIQMNESDKAVAQKIIKENLMIGSIDVNIMSKGDTIRYKNIKERLPDEYNDAHAAVRGFLKSKLKNTTLIISAGLNPKLFTYLSKCQEILPNSDGVFEKKIALKVSDYRSALIQGKYLAQRGVWTSEFRIESGLNCGGHAFATKGLLLGPILEEFKTQRNDLISEMRELYIKALIEKGIKSEGLKLSVSISAQGGIGTFAEAKFIQSNYGINSTGWGSPFLLVPEVINVDTDTLKLLCDATQEDIYLSNTSPFGIPFYTVVGNSKDEEKDFRIKRNLPGSICPKRFVALNTEFGEPALCSASKEYQKLKIEDIKKKNLPNDLEKMEIKNVTDKTCICVGLGTSALLVNNLEHRIEGNGVSVCPGPNLAYYSKVLSLNEMVDHIYGRADIITDKERPHVFLKEISLYVNYLKEQIQKSILPISDKQKTYFIQFGENIEHGIDYYRNLITRMKNESDQWLSAFDSELKRMKENLLDTVVLKLQVNQ